MCYMLRLIFFRGGTISLKFLCRLCLRYLTLEGVIVVDMCSLYNFCDVNNDDVSKYLALSV